MKMIIEWLIQVEHLASEVYFKASEHFSQDREFSRFLSKLSEDEAMHYHVMVSAIDHLRDLPDAPPSIILDTDTRQNIESVFYDIGRKVENRVLTKNELVDALIKTEFSEWNHLFLYVVNRLKESIREFTYAAIRIQNHKRAIEYFCESSFNFNDKIKSLKQVCPVWNEKILIVEDDIPVAELLKAILNGEGDIDIAGDGIQGLEKVRKNYYKLIISDVDMPNMDGLEFFEQARVICPAINERFLFFTGGASAETIAFFEKYGIDYLKKPSSINLIQQKALEILLSDYNKSA